MILMYELRSPALTSAKKHWCTVVGCISSSLVHGQLLKILGNADADSVVWGGAWEFAFPTPPQETLMLLFPALRGVCVCLCGWEGMGGSPTDLGTVPGSHACKLCDLGHATLPL